VPTSDDAPEAPAEAPADPSTDPEIQEVERGADVRVARAGWVVAAAFLVTTVVLGAVAASLRADRDELRDERREVEEVAGQFSEALLEFDPGDIEGARDRVLALAAPPFTNEYEEVYRVIIEPAAASVTSITEPTITDIFVSDIDDGTASVIVVYDRQEVSAEETRLTENNVYMRLGLVQVDGEWRVNDVINLTFAGAGGTAGTSTTTTAPPPSEATDTTAAG
jgi:hypothetical protein